MFVDEFAGQANQMNKIRKHKNKIYELKYNIYYSQYFWKLFQLKQKILMILYQICIV